MEPYGGGCAVRGFAVTKRPILMPNDEPEGPAAARGEPAREALGRESDWPVAPAVRGMRRADCGLTSFTYQKGNC